MEYPIQQRESNEHNLPPRNNSFKIKFRYKFHFIGIKILDAIQIRAQAENLLHSCFRFWVSILTSHVQKSPVVEQWVDFQTALQNTRPFLGKNSFSFSNLDTLLIGWLLRFWIFRPLNWNKCFILWKLAPTTEWGQWRFNILWFSSSKEPFL